MPRNVRNFYITGQLDGHQKQLSAGPKGESGCIDLFIRIRENGTVSDKYLRVTGQANKDGKLVLRARAYSEAGYPDGEPLVIETDR